MTYPSCLDTYLDLIQDPDDAVSHEAALALRHLIAKVRIKGDARWLSDVEAFLVPQPCLAERGVKPLKNLAMTDSEVHALATEVFCRVTAGAPPAWRHAYVLKDAGGFPDLDTRIAEHIRNNWREDEAVAMHLMYPLWDHETNVGLLRTYERIAVEAKNEHLRHQAANRAEVTRQLAAHKAGETAP